MDGMHENQGMHETEVIAPEGGFWVSVADIFLEPNKVFRRIDSGLEWWKAFIGISIIQVVIAWFSIPIQRQILSLNERGMTEEQLSKALHNLDKFGFVGLITAPIAILVVFLITALIINISVNLLSGRSNYKKALSLAIFTGFIAVIEQIISLLVVRLRGIELIESSAGAKISLSLAPLFPNLGKFGSAFLESLSVFGIWYYIVLTLGIAAVFKIDIKKSVIPVIILWIISMLFLYLGKALGGI